MCVRFCFYVLRKIVSGWCNFSAALLICRDNMYFGKHKLNAKTFIKNKAFFLNSFFLNPLLQCVAYNLSEPKLYIEILAWKCFLLSIYSNDFTISCSLCMENRVT